MSENGNTPQARQAGGACRVHVVRIQEEVTFSFNGLEQ